MCHIVFGFRNFTGVQAWKRSYVSMFQVFLSTPVLPQRGRLSSQTCAGAPSSGPSWVQMYKHLLQERWVTSRVEVSGSNTSCCVTGQTLVSVSLQLSVHSFPLCRLDRPVLCCLQASFLPVKHRVTWPFGKGESWKLVDSSHATDHFDLPSNKRVDPQGMLLTGHLI